MTFPASLDRDDERNDYCPAEHSMLCGAIVISLIISIETRSLGLYRIHLHQTQASTSSSGGASWASAPRSRSNW
jgi:hypothetical protein